MWRKQYSNISEVTIEKLHLLADEHDDVFEALEAVLADSTKKTTQSKADALRSCFLRSKGLDASVSEPKTRKLKTNAGRNGEWQDVAPKEKYISLSSCSLDDSTRTFFKLKDKPDLAVEFRSLDEVVQQKSGVCLTTTIKMSEALGGIKTADVVGHLAFLVQVADGETCLGGMPKLHED